MNVPWSVLEPSVWSIDEGAARALVAEALKTPQDGDRPDDWRRRVEAAIDVGFQARFGPAAWGWRWGYGEASLDGGVVRSWCCAGHSVVPEGGDGALLRSPEADAATVERAVGGLREWRAHVEELAQTFARLRPPLTDALALARALTALTDLSVLATRSGSAWYGHARWVMGWYLESRGLDRAEARRLVVQHVDGRFESWSAPAESVREAVALDLAHGLIGDPLPDALDAWRRMSIDWSDPPPDLAAALARVRAWGPSLAAHDGYVVRYDLTRDDGDERAAAMMRALDFVRNHALTGAPLDWETLTQAHKYATGRSGPSPTRRGNAYAKAGAERYGWFPDFEERLIARLTDTSGHSLVRAARVYLDVCFWHPFDDGNARAARLAFEHILTGSGYALADVAPVFSVPRVAGDADASWELVRVIVRLASQP